MEANRARSTRVSRVRSMEANRARSTRVSRVRSMAVNRARCMRVSRVEPSQLPASRPDLKLPRTASQPQPSRDSPRNPPHKSRPGMSLNMLTSSRIRKSNPKSRFNQAEQKSGRILGRFFLLNDR
jgi:hypothetical protein